MKAQNKNHNLYLTDYVTCALWAEQLDDQEISTQTLEEMNDDLSDFFDLIERIKEDVDGEYNWSADEWNLLDDLEGDQIAHDFWLTRNGHGAGFWDRGLGRVGDVLTQLSKPYGECWLYLGDDGKVYAA